MGKKTAVLVGHNYNSILGVARALGAEGYEVGAIRTGVYTGRNIFRRIGQTPEKSCKYISKYRLAPTKDVDGILRMLKENFPSPDGKAVLIPVDDICAELIDEHLDELRPFFFMPNVNDTPGGVIRLMDKYYQKQLAREAGLAVPDGWSISINNGKYRIPNEIKYPCFVKPEMPIVGRKRYMGKCSSKEKLVEVLDRAATLRNCIMIVEEYVEIEKEFGAVGVCNRGKVCIPGITEKIVLAHGSNAGVTACGKIHKPDTYAVTAKKMEFMMAKTGFQGLFDIDLYESKGVMFFNELNVRIGAEGIGTLIAGVNLAKLFADSFFPKEQNNAFFGPAEEITFANEKPLISDWGERFISFEEYREFLKNMDRQYIASDDDKGPSRYFKWQIARQFARRIIRRKK